MYRIVLIITLCKPIKIQKNLGDNGEYPENRLKVTDEVPFFEAKLVLAWLVPGWETIWELGCHLFYHYEGTCLCGLFLAS